MHRLSSGLSARISSAPSACRTDNPGPGRNPSRSPRQNRRGPRPPRQPPGRRTLAELDDATAYRPFQPVVGATGDELPIDLDLGEREGLEPHQRRPVGTEIVDRDGDVVEPHLPCEIDQQIQIVDDLVLLISISSPPMPDAPASAGRDRGSPGLLRRDRQVDRDIGRALLVEQIAPILRGPVDHELRQTQAMRIVVLRDKIGRRTTPEVGCRIRTSASAPRRTRVRASIFC